MPFYGRGKEIKELKKIIFQEQSSNDHEGPINVICITGESGIGKTTLAYHIFNKNDKTSNNKDNQKNNGKDYKKKIAINAYMKPNWINELCSKLLLEAYPKMATAEELQNAAINAVSEVKSLVLVDNVDGLDNGGEIKISRFIEEWLDKISNSTLILTSREPPFNGENPKCKNYCLKGLNNEAIKKIIGEDLYKLIGKKDLPKVFKKLKTIQKLLYLKWRSPTDKEKLNNCIRDLTCKKDPEKIEKTIEQTIRERPYPITHFLALGRIRNLEFDETLLSYLWDCLGGGSAEVYVRTLKKLFEDQLLTLVKKEDRFLFRLNAEIHMRLQKALTSHIGSDNLGYVDYFISRYFLDNFLRLDKKPSEEMHLAEQSEKMRSIEQYVYHSLLIENFDDAYSFVIQSNRIDEFIDLSVDLESCLKYFNKRIDQLYLAICIIDEIKIKLEKLKKDLSLLKPDSNITKETCNVIKDFDKLSKDLENIETSNIETFGISKIKVGLSQLSNKFKQLTEKSDFDEAQTQDIIQKFLIDINSPISKETRAEQAITIKIKLAKSLQDLSKHGECIELMKDAKKILTKDLGPFLKDKTGNSKARDNLLKLKWKVYNLLATSCSDTGKSKKSLEYYFEVVEASINNKYIDENVAYSLGSIGHELKFYNNAIEKAEEVGRKAVEISENINENIKIKNMCCLAQTLLFSDKKDESLELFEKALEYCNKSNNDQREKVRILIQYALGQIANGQLSEAEKQLDEGLKLIRNSKYHGGEYKDRRREYMAFAHKGILLYKKNQRENGKKQLLEAIKMHNKINDRRNLVYELMTYGWMVNKNFKGDLTELKNIWELSQAISNDRIDKIVKKVQDEEGPNNDIKMFIDFWKKYYKPIILVAQTNE